MCMASAQNAFGAMAPYMKFPRDAINHKVPKACQPNMPCLSSRWPAHIHAVQRGNIELGDVVVIAGAGPLGSGHGRGGAPEEAPGCSSRRFGRCNRLDVAKRCGADLGLNPKKIDVVDEVLKLTEGYGCDVYIEATGHPSAVEQGLHMIRKLGTFVEFSVMREPVTVDWTIIGDTKELNIHGAHLGPYCYPIAMDMLMKGLLPMDRHHQPSTAAGGFSARHRSG